MLIPVIAISLVLAALTVARITRFLTDDFLALGYRRWIVKRYGDESKMSYLAHCPWCTSVWVAIPIMPVAAIWPNRWVIAGLAILAASMVSGLLIDRKE